MRSTESAIWRLIASFGILMSDIMHHVSPYEPGIRAGCWSEASPSSRRGPVFIAASKVEALAAANFAQDDAVGDAYAGR
jgi:hypothetical protein